ncbi:hypothetical protein PF010_g2545 [Phytophthora fragariae]|uniref:Replication protein A OB domain-containing protein n=1 Tax=Phytophthora fragariae TaxID=53985 RepID=A0A6G0LXP8_9STRA|nr:hypothetical protein PF010_g2545 [Phytophthora fragariae]
MISVELTDSEGARIRACAFNKSADTVASKMHMVEVYRVRRGAIQSSKRQFTAVPHSNEILLSEAASIEAVADNSTIAHPQYQFTEIRSLAAVAENSLVDVIGVAVKIEDIDYVEGENGQLLKKREVLLTDTSDVSVILTLWNEFADYADDELLGKVIAVWRCRVSPYHVRSIAMGTGSMVVVKPKAPQLQELQRWYDETHASTVIPIAFVAFEFTPNADALQSAHDASVNIVGIIQRVGPVVQVRTNDGRLLVKREVVVKDLNSFISCTLWQDAAEYVTNESQHHVIAVHNRKAVRFKDPSVGTRTDCADMLDPNIPACQSVTEWFQRVSAAAEAIEGGATVDNGSKPLHQLEKKAEDAAVEPPTKRARSLASLP